MSEHFDGLALREDNEILRRSIFLESYLMGIEIPLVSKVLLYCPCLERVTTLSYLP